MKTILALIVTLLMVTANTHAEDTFSNPDKVYLQLDRSLYAQGDTVWIKGYAMHRGSNQPSNNSHSLHVQMLDEQGREVHNYKLLIVDGMAVGQIPLSSVMAPGYYQLIAHTGYMKNFDRRFCYSTKIEVRKPVRQSTISVMYDKPSYRVGETANVTFTMLDKNKTPIPDARFVCDYIEGDASPKRKRLRCHQDGTVRIPFPISAGSHAQMPRLKLSYYETPGDKHPLIQEVYVPMHNDNISVEFFPEGGDLIQGIASKVAFKATDVRGVAVEVSVDVFEDGQKILTSSTVHQGMGVCSFVPKQAKYTAVVTSLAGAETHCDLPEVKGSGYTLALMGQTEDEITLCVKHNMTENKPCQLWISYCDSLWNVKSFVAEQMTKLTIDKYDFPQGIVTFTLSDENNQPRAERLVYIDMETPSVEINVSQEVFGPRQKVQVMMALDMPSVAQLSYAVVDSTLATSPKINPTSIKAYAQFESELQGRIDNPNQYLGHGTKVAQKRDLLLLTHGWRRFEWVDNEKALTNRELHNFNRVTGQVTRLRLPYSNAQMSALTMGKSFTYSTFEADDHGAFYFEPIYRARTDQDILLMSRSRRGNRGVTLKLADTDTVLFSSFAEDNKDNLLPVLQSSGFVTRQNNPTTVEQAFMSFQNVMLDEFVVSADKKEWGMDYFFKIADDVALGKDLEETKSFYWLLNQFSNLILDGSDGTGGYDMNRVKVKTIDCLDRDDMVYMVDGTCVFVHQEDLNIIFGGFNPPAAMIYVNGDPWGYEIAPLDYFKLSDIASIAIMDGAKGYRHFGIEAYYGAIMVETYDKSLVNEYKLHLSHAVFGNFVQAREFSKQQYDISEESHTGADDKRVTLHWEPLLETDLNGEAEVSFFTSDIPGKKQIIVQGLDYEGNLYYQTASFYVEDIYK